MHRLVPAFALQALQCLMVAVWALAPIVALAQKPADVTIGEMALLPEYCADTMGFEYGDAYTRTSPRAAYWVSLMGPSFWHVHHYCWGLIKLERVMTPGTRKELRAGGLKNVAAEMKYVLRNGTPDFILRPEILVRLGDVLILDSEPSAAREAYASARRLKPDYWPAYTRWADVLAKLGLRRDALALLEEGLRIMPGEKALQQAYGRLGGNTAAFLLSLPPPKPAASSAAASGASAPGH
jgi:hypothetical protein